jgi:hypothetical protein
MTYGHVLFDFNIASTNPNAEPKILRLPVINIERSRGFEPEAQRSSIVTGTVDDGTGCRYGGLSMGLEIPVSALQQALANAVLDVTDKDALCTQYTERSGPFAGLK